MRYKLGHSKTGGRTAGTPNKKTERLMDLLGEYGIEPIKEIVNLLPSLTPKEQVDVYRDLLSYIYPKRKAIEHSGETTSPLTELSDDELDARIAKLRASLRTE